MAETNQTKNELAIKDDQTVVRKLSFIARNFTELK